MPVNAPPYGSRADGELWVSTLNTRECSSLNLMTPALSLNTERQKSLSPMRSRTSLVVRWMNDLNRDLISCLLPFSSSYCTVPAKILCLQCSDQVCARHSSSTSVGFAP